MPRTRTTSGAEPGGRAHSSRVVGQVMYRRPSSSTLVSGRLTWKSWYSSGSSSVIGVASQTWHRWPTAPLAASPASFQPSKAETRTGSRKGGTDDSSLTDPPSGDLRRRSQRTGRSGRPVSRRAALRRERTPGGRHHGGEPHRDERIESAQ